jgi:hypothetical protein
MPAKDELGSGHSKLVSINQAAVRGEPGTGYEAAKNLGEFECENCKWFSKPGACNQKDMKAKSKQPRLPDGKVKVDPEGCCEYVWRIGRKDEDEE